MKKNFPFIPNTGTYLVKPEAPQKITSGGIEIPDSATQRPMEGKIVAIEDFKSGDAPKYKSGDHVLFGKYDGIEVRINEEEFLLLECDRILGKRI
jgi:chaperonin GroES